MKGRNAILVPGGGMIMTDKMNTDGFFAAELSLDDLENVAGGMSEKGEEWLSYQICRFKYTAASGKISSDLSEWGTTKKEMLKIIDDAFII
jgi:hypothetical protein